jgi:hypothetical protein
MLVTMDIDSTSDSDTGSDTSGRRFFTLEQANRTLPLVRRVVGDIVDAYAVFAHLQIRRQELQGELSEDDAFIMDAEVDAAAVKLNRLMSELGQIGCELKDPQIGLIDFPAIYSGREVLLCWKAGEDDIEFWHETSTGFAGRKPVSELGS